MEKTENKLIHLECVTSLNFASEIKQRKRNKGEKMT